MSDKEPPVYGKGYDIPLYGSAPAPERPASGDDLDWKCEVETVNNVITYLAIHGMSVMANAVAAMHSERISTRLRLRAAEDALGKIATMKTDCGTMRSEIGKWEQTLHRDGTDCFNEAVDCAAAYFTARKEPADGEK